MILVWKDALLTRQGTKILLTPDVRQHRFLSITNARNLRRWNRRGRQLFTVGHVVSNSPQTMVLLTCCILTVVVLLSETTGVVAEGEELCETLPSEIHIIKEEFDELGRLQRTCNGEIAVNKCEGACNSQVQPSVITPTGFLKECYCCRESFLRERIITLTHCYDPDGIRLTTDEHKSMDIKLKEPNECKCYKCGDFSR